MGKHLLIILVKAMLHVEQDIQPFESTVMKVNLRHQDKRAKRLTAAEIECNGQKGVPIPVFHGHHILVHRP